MIEETLGRILNRRRLELDESTPQMGARVHVHHSTIQNWENDLVIPGEERIPDISKGYRLETDLIQKSMDVSRKKRVKENQYKNLLPRGKTEHQLLHGRLNSKFVRAAYQSTRRSF